SPSSLPGPARSRSTTWSASGRRGGCRSWRSSAPRPGSRSRSAMKFTKRLNPCGAKREPRGRRGVRTFPPPLDSELQLHGVGLGLVGRPRWAFTEFVTSAHAPDAHLELTLVLIRRMWAAPVQRGVAGDHDRELRREKVVVVLLDLGVDLERAMPERCRAGLARGAGRRVERFLAVADAW